MAESSGSSQPKGGDAARLVGAWRLVTLHNPGAPAAGPDGPAADGLIVYDAGGYMSAQILSPEGEPGGGRTFHSYFGPYSLDAEAATVTHHRIANTTPDAPRDVVRGYRFAAEDELVLSPEGHPGMALTFRRARR